MTKPTSIVLSRDSTFTSELPKRLSSLFDFCTCESLHNVGEVARKNQAQAVLIDLQRVTGGGHAQADCLEELHQQFPELEIYLIIGEECPEPLERLAAISGMQHWRGDVDIEQIAEWLEKRFATELAADLASNDDLTHAAVDCEPDTIVQGLTRSFETSSPRLKRMLADLEIAAQHDVTILLIGETGSGKTYLSSLIHELSPRRNEPLLVVPCGALPSELIESELFGHVKGAFTSAHADKEGKFVAAGCGTILLDEIDALGLEQQVKLLRVIESGEFEPVGSNETIQSQARLVVASNLELQPLVEQHKFRPDLYYRLNQLKFEILPLRERKCDIASLAKKFIDQSARKYNINIDQVEDDLFVALYKFPWNGNVRELEYVIQRAVIYCRDGTLSANQLPEHVVSGFAGPMNDPSMQTQPTSIVVESNLNQQIALTEKEIIEQALFKNNYSRTKTAKELGISRVTLYNKMKKYRM